MVELIISIVLSFPVAIVAHIKRWGFFFWGIMSFIFMYIAFGIMSFRFGFFVGILSMVIICLGFLTVVILHKPDQEDMERHLLKNGMKKCPYCAEFVKEEAKLCKFCGRAFEESKGEDCKEKDNQKLASRLINITCPKCSANLGVPERLFGKKAKCPKCDTAFSIPSNPSAK